MNWKRPLLISAIVILIALLGFATKDGGNASFDEAKELIIMRQIAHQVLRSTGDSTTRILSVKKLEGAKFEIPFQTNFSFTPDSLVKTIDRVIRENKLPGNYIVNVVEEASQKVVFGYAIFENKQNDIIPCTGREQPSRKYLITLQFEEQSVNWRPFAFLLVGGLVIWLLARSKRQVEKPSSENNTNAVQEKDGEKEMNGRPEIQPNQPIAITGTEEEDPKPQDASTTEAIEIGRYNYNPSSLELHYEGALIDLTEKEAKVLYILATHLNELVDRSRLQKEIWEDEGVIVGRSLDVFISRLRKKFEQDPTVKITSVPKKGYSLVVETGEQGKE